LSESQFLIVDCGSEKVDSIQDIVHERGFTPLRVRSSEVSQMDPSAHYSGIIISGSPILLTEIDYSQLLKSFEFIRTARSPVLGICFGHQIMGLLHGAKVFRGLECRTNLNITVLDRDELFEGLESTLSLREDHCEGISLPSEFSLLAKSEKYDIEAMKHRHKQLYGTQFHPEVSGEIGEEIIGNFLNLCEKVRFTDLSKNLIQPS